MISPRERQLAEGIKNRLIGIQKSEQIYKHLSKLERKALKRDENNIDRKAKQVASKVEKWVVKREKLGNPPTPQDVMKNIQEELDKIAR
jgi:DNA-directed RNA polymerase